jgi:ABC-type Fe3+-citrate transport system substrate-binding protein
MRIFEAEQEERRNGRSEDFRSRQAPAMLAKQREQEQRLAETEKKVADMDEKLTKILSAVTGS